MKKKNPLMRRCLSFFLVLALVLGCTPISQPTRSYAAGEESSVTLTELCDASGYAKISNYSMDDLYASVDLGIAYAFYGKSMSYYYGYYPTYFASEGTDYYEILVDLIGDQDYVALTAANADGVSALDCLKVLSGNWMGNEVYWYLFAFIDESALEAPAEDSSEQGGEESGSEAPSTEESGEATPGTEESGEATPGTEESGEVVSGTDESGEVALGTDESDEVAPGTDESGEVAPGTDESGEVAPGTDESDEVAPGTEESDEAEPGSEESGEVYPSAEPAEEEPAEEEPTVTYVNLYNGNGTLQYAYYEDSDLYFSLTAALEYACYSYTLTDYYGWYPSYFKETDGTDVYQLLAEKLGGDEYGCLADEELLALVKRLSACYYKSEAYYPYFCHITSDKVGGGSSSGGGESLESDFIYVAKQYVQLGDANGDLILPGYDDDFSTLEERISEFAVSLTDPQDYALYGYTMEDYYGWYPTYFQDENGTDVYAAMEEKLNGKRFLQMDETVLSYVKTLSKNWYGDASYWYLFTYIDTGYIEIYDELGYTNVDLTMMEEVYVNLNQRLQYCMLDLDGDFTTDVDAPYSLTEAYESEDWAALFVDPDSDVDLYTQLAALITETDEFGFARLTSDMIPILRKLAFNRWSAYGDYSNYWDVFCFYKKTDISGLDNPYADDEAIGEKVLLAGDADLADEDAYILTLFGDGFDASEQEAFYTAAQELADYMMATSPFDELKAAIKIYAIGVVSNESGISNENVKNYRDVNKAENVVDTYFSSSFWASGIQRLVTLDKAGAMKLASLTRFLVPDSDISGVIVNSAVYGGSGGSYLTTSLEASAAEIFIHEFGHTGANLADEYYEGEGYEHEAPNMTQNNDPETVKWAKFIGVDGCSICPYTDYYGNETGWYRPVDNCKMQYLGTNYPFCPVCKEEIRKSVSAGSDVTMLFWQPYADTSFADENELAGYLILRKNGEEMLLSEVPADTVTYTYTDADGKEYKTQPMSGGSFTVTAAYCGGDEFEACEVSFEAVMEELPEEVTVTFDANGAKKNPKSVTVAYGKTLKTLPTAGSVTGTTFDGWFILNKDGTLGEKLTRETVIKSDITAVAVRKLSAPTVIVTAKPDNKAKKVVMTAKVTQKSNLSYSYQWYMNGEEISGETGTSLTVEKGAKGVYTCKVTVTAENLVTTGAVSGTGTHQILK